MKEDGIIHETEWKSSVNTLVEYKHFYAEKNGEMFVAIATRTLGIGFWVLPTMQGSTIVHKLVPKHDDEAEAKAKVQAWLDL